MWHTLALKYISIYRKHPVHKRIPAHPCHSQFQICLEGQIKESTISDGLRRGRRAAGDLIPWTVAQQFGDNTFPLLSGARIVRIATHPDYQGMGYGARALSLLRQYYQHGIPSLDAEDTEMDSNPVISQVEDSEVGLLEETIEPKSSLPPLLLKLSERRPEHLDYLGVSYGLTEQLLKFWKRGRFVPVYVRQTSNEITGENSCIMLSSLQDDTPDWLAEFWEDFRGRFVELLSSSFRYLFHLFIYLFIKTDGTSPNTIM